MTTPGPDEARRGHHTSGLTPFGRNKSQHCGPGHRSPARPAPSPEVVAAAEFLLAQPDAYRYRRRYLELVARSRGADGTAAVDYTAGERYLLATATTLRRAMRQDASAAQTQQVPGNKDDAGLEVRKMCEPRSCEDGSV